MTKLKPMNKHDGEANPSGVRGQQPRCFWKIMIWLNALCQTYVLKQYISEQNEEKKIIKSDNYVFIVPQYYKVDLKDRKRGTWSFGCKERRDDQTKIFVLFRRCTVGSVHYVHECSVFLSFRFLFNSLCFGEVNVKGNNWSCNYFLVIMIVVN